jgi:hypothetical protein
MNKETLEEVAERLKGKELFKESNDRARETLSEIKSSEQETMYSEEEVIDLLQKALTHQDDGETGSLVTAQGQIRKANFYSWFINLKGLVIENSNDMNKAFSMYLQSNASHYYFTCDEFEKENFINQLKN